MTPKKYVVGSIYVDREGARLRVLATDLEGECPILAVTTHAGTDGSVMPRLFYPDGRFMPDGDDSWDLLNLHREAYTVWIRESSIYADIVQCHWGADGHPQSDGKYLQFREVRVNE